MNPAANGYGPRWLQAVFPFLRWLPGVDQRSLKADAVAGITGAVIVLPQGVAYALIAGLPPEYGLYTAIITPIVAGLFGSSWHLVSGPTAAISIIVFSVVGGVVPPDSGQFLPYVLALTFLAGVIQLALGLARLGALVNFISHTVVIGFTAGAAVLIGTSQLKHFFGLTLPAGESFISTLVKIAEQLPQLNPYSVAIAALTIITAVSVRRLAPRLPNMLTAMVLASVVCWVIDGAGNGVALVGAMSGQLPPLSTPPLGFDTLRDLAPGALAVAIIALIEAVSISRAVALRSHQRIDGNQEFIGQGLSNIAGSFFSCYAGSGSFTRTGANYDAGARTPLAAIFAAIVVALTLLFIPGMTAYLPMPAMAGVLMVIAWNLVDMQHIRQIVRASREETVILVATLLATLFLALEFAIYLGVLVSLVLYLRRSAQPSIVSLAPMGDREGRPLRNVAKRDLVMCPQLAMLRIDGSVFFGAVNHIQDVIESVSANGQRHILLIGSGVNFIDIAGAELLANQAKQLRAAGGGLYLCEFKTPALETVRRGGYMDAIGEDNVYVSPKLAIAELVPNRLDPERCRVCKARVFTECQAMPGA